MEKKPIVVYLEVGTEGPKNTSKMMAVSRPTFEPGTFQIKCVDRYTATSDVCGNGVRGQTTTE